MTESDDVAERGRAIFQRLREQEPEAPESTGSDGVAPESDQVPAPGDPVRNPLPGGADLPPLDLLAGAAQDPPLEAVSPEAIDLQSTAPVSGEPEPPAPAPEDGPQEP
ncbi:MAG: hypothetical protein ACRDZU_02775, partial [Acidimicrobiales bacterium]